MADEEEDPDDARKRNEINIDALTLSSDDGRSDGKHDETESEEKRKLFCGNIAFSTTKDQLTEFFLQFGNLEEVGLVLSEQKQSKGYGFITFRRSEGACRALEKPLTLHGRKLTLKYAVEGKLREDPYEVRRRHRKPPQQLRQQEEAITNGSPEVPRQRTAPRGTYSPPRPRNTAHAHPDFTYHQFAARSLSDPFFAEPIQQLPMFSSTSPLWTTHPSFVAQPSVPMMMVPMYQHPLLWTGLPTDYLVVTQEPQYFYQHPNQYQHAQLDARRFLSEPVRWTRTETPQHPHEVPSSSTEVSTNPIPRTFVEGRTAENADILPTHREDESKDSVEES